MKKHFKKRLAAFKVGLVLSIMITPFCFYKISEPVAALSNVTSSNSYGGYTWQIIDTMFDMDGNVTLSSAQISMNLNGHYNGSFTINISLSTIIDTTGIGYTNTINNYGFICNGCRITTYDSSHLYVAITDCNYWEIQIIPIKNASIKNWKSILNAFDISSITGWSMTKLDEITATQISTIQSTLTNINSNALTIHSDLNTTNTELHNLYNAISSGGTYGSIQSQLYNMGVNLSAEITQTIAIKDRIDSYLTGTIDNQTVNIWDLQNDANYSLSNIETTLNTISSHINDYTSQLNSIHSTLNSINSAVQNIDNTIDTISWTNCNVTVLGVYSDTTFNTGVTSGEIPGSYKYIKLSSLNDVYNFRTDLFKLNITIGNALVLNDLKYYWLNNGTYLTEIHPTVYYFRRYRNSFEIYLDFQNEFSYNAFPNGSGNIIIKLADNNPSGLYLYGNSFVHRINQNDIEYWQLLQYFNQYNMNYKLLESLQNLSFNVHGDVVNQTENVINNYDTDFTTINNIESTFTNNFDNTNPGVISLLNSNLQIPQGFVDGSTFVKTLFPKVVDNNSLVGFPYFLILAIVVLIVILG